jgi:hypothetical protein
VNSPNHDCPKPLSRLTLFALLFAWANILHQLSYPEWIKGLHPVGWLVFFGSIALALKPSSLRIFVAVLVLRVIYTGYWMPMIRGHLFLEGLFSLGILVGLAIEWRKLRKWGPLDLVDQERLFESFAPFLRLTCLVVYAAVTLSKLNTDFIDPEKSAAVQLLFWTADAYSFVPTAPWFQQFSIWATLAFECGIPILLCFKRTRWLGVVIGLIFHSLLGWLPLRIASFSLTMCLLLFVWLPPQSARLIQNGFLNLVRASRLTPRTFVFVVSFLAGMTGMLFAGRHGFNLDMHTLDLGMGIWWWQTAFMLAALWAVRGIAQDRLVDILRIRSWVLRFFVVFVVFNCLCPYLGLKTRSALSMHCNLRTEKGYWNHLFVPEAVRVFPYQDNLVTVVDSNLPDLDHLRGKGMPLPYFEFRRWCRLATDDFYVDYLDASGFRQRFEKRDGEGLPPALMQRSWLLEWFLCFNPAGASHDYIPGLVKRIGPPRNVVPTYPISPPIER